jgi:hypothetical protein
MRQRITEMSAGRADAEEIEELEQGSDDALRRALKSLFNLDDLSRRK